MIVMHSNDRENIITDDYCSANPNDKNEIWAEKY